MRKGLIKLTLALSLLAPTSFSIAQQKAQPADRGIPTIRVWVDTLYGFYHCPATKLYGKTKQGVYMTQKQAQDRGYRPAYGTVCNTVPTPTKAAPKAPAKK